QNTITGAIYGVYIGSDATGKVRNNSINNQVVPPSGPPEVNSGFGINVASADIAIYANNVSWNLTGIEAATDEIYGNNVHHNTVGIKGSGLIGGSSWAAGQPNDIHDNDTGVEAAGATTVLFNRIHHNVVGVRTDDNNSVHHNVLYRNSAQAVLVDS